MRVRRGFPTPKGDLLPHRVCDRACERERLGRLVVRKNCVGHKVAALAFE